jgi:hypothetical protein
MNPGGSSGSEGSSQQPTIADHHILTRRMQWLIVILHPELPSTLGSQTQTNLQTVSWVGGVESFFGERRKGEIEVLAGRFSGLFFPDFQNTKGDTFQERGKYYPA